MRLLKQSSTSRVEQTKKQSGRVEYANIEVLGHSLASTRLNTTSINNFALFPIEIKPEDPNDGTTINAQSPIPEVKKILKCDFCSNFNYLESEPENLKFHLKKVHKIPNFVNEFDCDSCDKLFKSDQAARWHHDSVHKGLKYVCKSCGKSTVQFHPLRKHIISEHGVNPQIQLDDSHYAFQVKEKILP